MQEGTAIPAPSAASSGRGWLWLGILVTLGGLAAAIGQVVILKQLTVPWYAAGLATVGAVLMAVAVFRRMTVTRGLILALLVALATFEWYVLAVFTRLPAYEGPATRGQRVPIFTARLADGSTFTDQDLYGDGHSVLLFFRGRW